MTCVIPDADTVNRWFVAPVRDASPAWAVLPADAGEHDDRPPLWRPVWSSCATCCVMGSGMIASSPGISAMTR